MKKFQVDQLIVEVYETRRQMGEAAAQAGIRLLQDVLKQKDEANVVFAAAPSQSEMLETLLATTEVDWSRVNAFHMDNYVGLDDSAPQQFSRFLRDRLFGKLPFKAVHYMGNQVGQEKEYAALLEQYPTDICFMGIGENAHIAFNDPGNAQFDDPDTVKLVELDHACRMQQVNEGNFSSLDDVPTHALTLTIPALMASSHVICTVPGINKAPATKCMLEGPIDEDCPASILRQHQAATLYLDQAAASQLK
ncbi:MAG: glucosamine-6-phosphate deaminase [Clostridiales bacterium]|nr:glucosamine-6-phosphate deaminase [Clostridiales bacterium]